MRKIGIVWITLSLMLAAFLLAGCQKKTSVGENGGAAAGDPAASALTEAEDWQTQYDLGLRYLSEGKYEEAIIAFTAAIQIEPRRAAGYTALADAYTKNGQTDEARRVLTEAPEDVDDPDAIQAALDEMGDVDGLIRLYASSISEEGIVEDSINEGAVGQMFFQCTCDTSRVSEEWSEKIYEFRIGNWNQEGFSEEDIRMYAGRHEEIWKRSGSAGERRYPDFNGGFPVWEEDLGTTQQVLVFALDGDRNIVGYLILPISIPG